jgi:hypothetical protein
MDDVNDLPIKVEDLYLIVAFGICWAVRSILVNFNKVQKDDTFGVPPVFFRELYNIGFSLFGVTGLILISSEFHSITPVHVSPWVSAFLKIGLFAGIISFFQTEAFREGYQQAWVHARQRLLGSNGTDGSE